MMRKDAIIPTYFNTSSLMRNAWRRYPDYRSINFNHRDALSAAICDAWSDARLSIQALVPAAVRAERVAKLQKDILMLSDHRPAANIPAIRARIEAQIANLNF